MDTPDLTGLCSLPVDDPTCQQTIQRRQDPLLLERGGKPPCLRWPNGSDNPALTVKTHPLVGFS